MRLILALCSLLMVAQSADAAPCSTSNSVVKVTNRKLGVFEFVDFYVKAPFTGTHSVTAATNGTFIEDGSGNPILVSGNKWTRVVFKNMDWMCSTAQVFALPKPILKDIKLIGQFEGQIEWAIGRLNGHYLGKSLTTVGSQKRLTLKYKP